MIKSVIAGVSGGHVAAPRLLGHVRLGVQSSPFFGTNLGSLRKQKSTAYALGEELNLVAIKGN